MEEIYIECEYTLLKKGNYSSSEKDYLFTKNIGEITITLDLSYEKKNIIVKVLGAYLQAEHIEELKATGAHEGEKLSDPCRESINEITNMAIQFAKDTLVLIKYHLCHHDIQENLRKRTDEKGDPRRTRRRHR